MQIKIFIGSSSENLAIAQWIKEIIGDLQQDFPAIELSAQGWWDVGSFPYGRSFYESLFAILDTIDAAILLAGGEDLVVKRNKEEFGPRDNIILEFGLVEGKKGRGRALMAITGMQTLPSDLAGINQLLLEEKDGKDAFKSANKVKLANWIFQIQQDINQHPHAADFFPRINQLLLQTIQNSRAKDAAFDYNEIDGAFADILQMVTSTSDEDSYITSLLVNSIKDDLEICRSILAIDVVGPKAWIGPNAYRYLAAQITYYLRRNFREDSWSPILSEQLYDELDGAFTHIHADFNMPQSLSGFDNRQSAFTKGQPRLEFARLLLWSREELLSSLADSVIAIHQAFNIPLFFKAAEPGHEIRKLDFVMLERNDGEIAGFYSSAATQNKPEPFTNIIPGKTNAKQLFYQLFSDFKPILAIDARAILKENPKAKL